MMAIHFSSYKQAFKIITRGSRIAEFCSCDASDYNGIEKVSFLVSKIPRVIRVNSDYYVDLLRNFIDKNSIRGCIQVHTQMIKTNTEMDIHICRKLGVMYAKNSKMDFAHQLFEELPEHDIVTWTSLISGYSQFGSPIKALNIFSQMLSRGFSPNEFTYPSALRACSRTDDLIWGNVIHGMTLKSGYMSHKFVGSALVDFHSKCGKIRDAKMVFEGMAERDLASWNGMVSAYVSQGDPESAWELFSDMHKAGMLFDRYTLCSILKGIGIGNNMRNGMQAHILVVKSGYDSFNLVKSALVDMYCKCGCMDVAKSVFDSLDERDPVAYTMLVTGYAQSNRHIESMLVFLEMMNGNVVPDYVTFSSILKACAGMAALEKGKQIHARILKSRRRLDVALSNALLDMYAKCGSLEGAQAIFHRMNEKKCVVFWTTMINAYANHGLAKSAFLVLDEMLRACVQPNDVTFLAILSACNHAGLLDDAFRYFNSMVYDHMIVPRAEHYTCLVDLLGRAGLLNDAFDLITKNMSRNATTSTWTALLNGCRVHCNVELGELVANQLFQIDMLNASTYLMLADIYSSVGRKYDVIRIRRIMRDREVRKEPACSWIEINKKVHTFCVRDQLHPDSQEIYDLLNSLRFKMKAAGYVPSTKFVHDY